MAQYLDLNHPSISDEAHNFIFDVNRMFEDFQERLSLTNEQREELKLWIVNDDLYQTYY